MANPPVPPRHGRFPAMNSSSQRGSVLIITLVFVTILGLAATSVFSLATSSYRLSMRNQLHAEARAVAESELEYLYYRFKMVVVTGNSAADAPKVLNSLDISDNETIPSTVREPFLARHRAAGWRVRRSLVLDPVIVNNNGPIVGRIPDTRKVGDYTYVVARIEVLPPPQNPFANENTSVRIGRRFINSNTSIFQYSIFFQGDLELNPGNDVTIEGDVVANGSIYMGPRSGFELKLIDQVRYLKSGFFNKDEDGNTTYYNPDIGPAPVTLVAPVFATSEESQLESMDQPENLFGGIDAAVTSKDRPDLFGPAGAIDSAAWTEAQELIAANNVYRSLIVPPPSASNSNEYPNATAATSDDNVIAVRRAYNRAELIFTVEADGTLTVARGLGGTINATSVFLNPTALDPSLGKIITEVEDGDGNPATWHYAKNVYDMRESKNVKVTEIDIGQLKKTLDYLRALPSANPNHFEFNGLLYVNLKSSSNTTPAAIRLINATSLPRNGDSGFSVATNGGIYVKGSYNTHLITNADGTQRPVPAMLIGDALTVLSEGWDDANAAAAFDGTKRKATADLTVNAGLLTGNIASTTGSQSGGAQNLVRYLEDWTGRTVTFYGSIGRLFQSAHFVASYSGSLTVSYFQPSNRNFEYDLNMRSFRPPGSPETTAFSRGSFFTWQHQ
jgi:hypothetical protein